MVYLIGRFLDSMLFMAMLVVSIVVTAFDIWDYKKGKS